MQASFSMQTEVIPANLHVLRNNMGTCQESHPIKLLVFSWTFLLWADYKSWVWFSAYHSEDIFMSELLFDFVKFIWGYSVLTRGEFLYFLVNNQFLFKNCVQNSCQTCLHRINIHTCHWKMSSIENGIMFFFDPVVTNKLFTYLNVKSFYRISWIGNILLDCL